MNAALPVPAKSALDDLLAHAAVHEEMGGELAPRLLRMSVVADAAILGMTVAALVVNSTVVHHLIVVPLLAEVGLLVSALMSALAPLLAIGAGLSLGLKACFWGSRAPKVVHYAAAADSLAALGFGAGWATLAVLLVVEAAVLVVAMVIGVIIAVLVVIGVLMALAEG